MILYFHFNDYMYEYPLPACNDRRVKLDLGEEMGGQQVTFHFEVWDHVWHILSGEDLILTLNDQPIDDHILRDGNIINGSLADNTVSFAITVHALNPSYTTYEKFAIEQDVLEIGGDSDVDIIIKGTYASKRHATLRKENGETWLYDHSTNGTYVQNRRVNGELKLDYMDTIYITGVKLVFMGDFLAINQPEQRIVKLPVYLPRFSEANAEATAKDSALIRSPRTIEPLDTESVELESPPAPQQQRRQPAIFIIGPALTMPLPILASVLIMSSQGSNFMMGMLVSVVLSAFMASGWAIANVAYERKTGKKDERFRQQAYLKYISDNEALLVQKQQKNAAILSGQYLNLSELFAVLLHNKSVLWNRNANQPDFLTIRLGIGFVDFQCPIIVPKRKFSLVADPLQSEPHNLHHKYRLLPHSTSLLNLRETKVIGVLGDKASVRKIAELIALQTAVLHCYTDVKMAFVLRSGEESNYQWARPLPHVRGQENKIRLMCTEDTERQNVFFYLNEILRQRIENKKENESADRKKPLLPHIIIFCTAPELLNGENLNRYMTEDGDYGVTFVLLYEVLDRLPNECTHIIQCDSDFEGYYRLDQARSETDAIRFDILNERITGRLARRISAYTVIEMATGEIPMSVSFFEMYGVASLKEWDLLKRWKENRNYESLRALVGIGTCGKPLYLDIHEKQHGPHGLIAGTTGSGKSETIQTYILSLAMNFHPNEIAFILIDYKGGGMANAFIGLPHLAGTITNLDGNQTMRALRSIKAEIRRRQTLFNQFNVNHIDNYSRYFREGAATEAMPHLIIISDEFAELKKEQPEFIRELVSTARVGRSLGIHLILATQKPSGVVDDEIWSNSRFKICLRVQDKQDSNEMLHRPDAAYLTNTGRAYMQIGNDEIFEMFQTGFSGAYYETENLASEEGTVTMIGLDGSPLILRKKKQSAAGENRPTHLSASVSFIHETAEHLGIAHSRPLWLPELCEGITLKDISHNYPIPQEKGITAVLGLVDDPSSQTQYGAVVNFSKLGNLLIAGMSGSGKSTMIQTILYSLALRYKAEEVNFYCIDCSGTLTRVFNDIPHCGGVMGADDSERIFRLFQLMNTLITERAALFEKAMVGSFEEYHMVSQEPLPLVLLLIDNLYAFSERYPDLVDDQMFSLSHICAKHGIHLVVSVNHLNDIRYKLRQNFDTVIPLQLPERGDYHDALGVMPEFVPSAKKGRGLWGKETLEYQAALAVAGENEQLRAENIRASFLRAGIGQMSAQYTGFHARQIQFIPKDQTYAEFMALGDYEDAIAIGYNHEDVSVVSLPLRSLYCYAVSGATHKGTLNMMQNMLDAAASLGGKRYMIALKHDTYAEGNYEGLYRDGESLFDLLVLLKEEFTKRSAMRKLFPSSDYFAAIREEYGLLFVFIDNMNEFMETIYSEHEEDYFPLVELFFKMGKGLGVYFIAGFESSVYGSNMFKDAYKRFVEHGTGIHLGGQLDKQKLFDISFISRESMKHLAITVGLTVLEEQFVNIHVPMNQLSK